MSVGAEVLEEFAHSLGIEGMVWPTSGAVRLEFEKRGVLWLESIDDALMVCLVRELGPGDDRSQILSQALAACHYRQGLPYIVQPGLRGESSLTLSVRLDSPEITLPTLEQVLELLTELLDSVRG